MVCGLVCQVCARWPALCPLARAMPLALRRMRKEGPLPVRRPCAACAAASAPPCAARGCP
eukprot:2075832-Pleurochrysis_carterae.AAC.1